MGEKVSNLEISNNSNSKTEDTSPLSVVSEELKVDPDTLYEKLYQICRIEAGCIGYEEKAVSHLNNLARSIEVLCETGGERFLIDSFNFLKEEGRIKTALMLRKASDTEEIWRDFELTSDFIEPFLRDCESSGSMKLKIHMVDFGEDDLSTHDYFLTFYPVYLTISDPVRISQIEGVVSRIEDREIEPV